MLIVDSKCQQTETAAPAAEAADEAEEEETGAMADNPAELIGTKGLKSISVIIRLLNRRIFSSFSIQKPIERNILIRSSNEMNMMLRIISTISVCTLSSISDVY